MDSQNRCVLLLLIAVCASSLVTVESSSASLVPDNCKSIPAPVHDFPMICMYITKASLKTRLIPLYHEKIV